MTRLKLLGAIVVVSTAAATPVFAQAAIQEPGAYAFYHPNGDLGIGSARPAADAMASVRFGSVTTSHPIHARHARSAKSY